jgi:hypothetical protein
MTVRDPSIKLCRQGPPQHCQQPATAKPSSPHAHAHGVHAAASTATEEGKQGIIVCPVPPAKRGRILGMACETCAMMGAM